MLYKKKQSLYILILLFFFIFGFLVFRNSLSGNFIWDDEAQILHNPLIHSIKNIPIFFTGGTFYIENSQQLLQGVYYRPLMVIFYSVIYHFFGLNPAAYHTVQLFVHILNTYLFYWLLLRLNKWKNTLIPFLLSLLFLIHPMNSEIVSYIANLQDVLFFFFGILALHLLISSKITIRNYIISFFLLFLSFLSKETAVVFVCINMIYTYLFNRWYFKISIFFSALLIILYAFLRCGFARICASAHKPNPIGDLPFLIYLVQIPALVIYYIKTFFYPLNLAIGQSWVIKHITFATFYLPFLILLSFFICLLFVLFKLFIQEHPYKKIYLFFVLWIGIGLTFHLHVLPLDFTVSDRWFYLPMAGLLATIGILINIFVNKRRMPIVASLLILLLAVFTYLTYQRNFDWHDNYTLFSRDIYKTENSFHMENNLGVELFRRKEYDKALKHFKKAVELAPDWHTPWTNIGIIYQNKKQYKQAEYAYKKAIEFKGLYKAYQNYIALLIEQGREKEALKFIETQALKEFPDNQHLIKTYQQLKL